MSKTGLEKSIDVLKKEMQDEQSIEFGNLLFNGAFVAMHKGVFNTANASLDAEIFRSAIIGDRGSASLQLLTPGYVFPLHPSRPVIEDSEDTLSFKQVDPFMDRVVVLANGGVLDKTKEYLTEKWSKQFNDSFIMDLSQRVCQTPFSEDEKNTTYGCVADLQFYNPSDEYVRNIFTDIFYDIPKDKQNEYLIYFTADPVTMTTFASKLFPASERVVQPVGGGKKRRTRVIEDEIYLAKQTIRTKIENSRLNTTEHEYAYIRPVFHSENELMLDPVNFEADFFGENSYLCKEPVLQKYNQDYKWFAATKEKLKVVPPNGFACSQAATIVLSAYNVVGDIDRNAKRNSKFYLMTRLEVIRNLLMYGPTEGVKQRDLMSSAVTMEITNKGLSPAGLRTYRNENIKDLLATELGNGIRVTQNPWPMSERACVLTSFKRGLIALSDEGMGNEELNTALKKSLVSSSSITHYLLMLDLQNNVAQADTFENAHESANLALTAQSKVKDFKIRSRGCSLANALDYVGVLMAHEYCDPAMFKIDVVLPAILTVGKHLNMCRTHQLVHPRNKQSVCDTCNTVFYNREESGSEKCCLCYVILRSLLVYKVLTDTNMGQVAIDYMYNICWKKIVTKKVGKTFSFNFPMRVNEQRSQCGRFGNMKIENVHNSEAFGANKYGNKFYSKETTEQGTLGSGIGTGGGKSEIEHEDKPFVLIDSLVKHIRVMFPTCLDKLIRENILKPTTRTEDGKSEMERGLKSKLDQMIKQCDYFNEVFKQPYLSPEETKRRRETFKDGETDIMGSKFSAKQALRQAFMTCILTEKSVQIPSIDPDNREYIKIQKNINPVHEGGLNIEVENQLFCNTGNSGIEVEEEGEEATNEKQACKRKGESWEGNVPKKRVKKSDDKLRELMIALLQYCIQHDSDDIPVEKGEDSPYFKTINKINIVLLGKKNKPAVFKPLYTKLFEILYNDENGGLVGKVLEAYFESMGNYMRGVASEVGKKLCIKPDELDTVVVNEISQVKRPFDRILSVSLDTKSTPYYQQQQAERKAYKAIISHVWDIRKHGDGEEANSLKLENVKWFLLNPNIPHSKLINVNVPAHIPEIVVDEEKGPILKMQKSPLVFKTEAGMNSQYGDIRVQYFLPTTFKVKVQAQPFCNLAAKDPSMVVDEVDPYVVESNDSYMSFPLIDKEENELYGSRLKMKSAESLVDLLRRHSIKTNMLGLQKYGPISHQQILEQLKDYLSCSDKLASEGKRPLLYRCILRDIESILSTVRLMLVRIDKWIETTFDVSLGQGTSHVLDSSLNFNNTLLELCKRQPHIAVICHFLFTCTELYTDKVGSLDNKIDVDFERDSALANAITAGILRLQIGGPSLDSGKRNAKEKCVKPMNILFLDKSFQNCGRGNENEIVNLKTFDTIETGFMSHVVIPVQLQSYTAPKDATKIFTAVRSSIGFGTKELLGDLCGLAGDDYYNTTTMIKRAMTHFTSIFKKQKELDIGPFMLTATLEDIAAALENEKISARGLADHYLQFLPTHAEHGMERLSKSEEELVTLIVRDFHKDYDDSHGRDMFKNLIGSYIFPYMINYKNLGHEMSVSNVLSLNFDDESEVEFDWSDDEGEED